MDIGHRPMSIGRMDIKSLSTHPSGVYGPTSPQQRMEALARGTCKLRSRIRPESSKLACVPLSVLVAPRTHKQTTCACDLHSQHPYALSA